MKQVNGYAVKEFTYDSAEERAIHVSLMEHEGWENSGQVKRLKPDVDITKATKDDHEWYGSFRRNIYPYMD
jgi:hypothetical protein